MPLLNNSELYIITFIVTGLWDIVLRIMTENWDQLPPVVKKIFPFIEYLQPYFESFSSLALTSLASLLPPLSLVLPRNVLNFSLPIP